MPEIKKFTLGISNMYFIREKGIIIVDTGSEKDKKRYLEAFSAADITPGDVTLIVVTHGHSDHFSFAGELKNMTGAPVLCHSLATEALRTGINPEFIPRNGGEGLLEHTKTVDLSVFSTVEPDLTFDDEFDLGPYGLAGRVIHTPGHSICSSSVVLDSGDAFVGDMLIDSPLTGEMRLPFLAVDERMLFEGYDRLLGTVEMFHGGHGTPIDKKHMLRLIAGDGSPEAAGILDKYYKP